MLTEADDVDNRSVCLMWIDAQLMTQIDAQLTKTEDSMPILANRTVTVAV